MLIGKQSYSVVHGGAGGLDLGSFSRWLGKE